MKLSKKDIGKYFAYDKYGYYNRFRNGKLQLFKVKLISVNKNFVIFSEGISGEIRLFGTNLIKCEWKNHKTYKDKHEAKRQAKLNKKNEEEKAYDEAKLVCLDQLEELSFKKYKHGYFGTEKAIYSREGFFFTSQNLLELISLLKKK